MVVVFGCVLFMLFKLEEINICIVIIYFIWYIIIFIDYNEDYLIIVI